MSLMDIDLGTVFEFSHETSGEFFGMTLATLLQCLCVAEELGFVPPLDTAWSKAVIPSVIQIRTQRKVNC